MIEGEGKRNHASPRMTDDHGLVYSHPLQGFGKELRLSRRGPNSVAGSLAVTKARSVEGDDPAAEARARNKAAYLHIGRGHAVAVKQYDRGARSPGVDLMQSNATYPKEVALRGIFSLSVNRVLLVDRRQCCQSSDRSQRDRTH